MTGVAALSQPACRMVVLVAKVRSHNKEKIEVVGDWLPVVSIVYKPPKEIDLVVLVDGQRCLLSEAKKNTFADGAQFRTVNCNWPEACDEVQLEKIRLQMAECLKTNLLHLAESNN